MDRLHDLLDEQGAISVIATSVSVGCLLISACTYSITSINDFHTSLSPLVPIFLLLSAFVGFLSFFLCYKEMKIASFLLCLAGFLFYLDSQANYLGKLITSYEGVTASASLIAMFILCGLSLLSSFFGFLFLYESLRKVSRVEIDEKED